MTNTIRAAAVQFEHAAGDKDANFAKMTFARIAARFVCNFSPFPNAASPATGSCEISPARTLLAGRTVPAGPRRTLLDLARENDATIGAGLVESDGDRLFNTYVVAMPDGQVRRHRRIQAFESEHISAGSDYTVFDTPHGVRVGV